MISRPASGKRQPRNLWLIARTYLLAEHESTLEEALSCISPLDLEFSPRPFLGVQGLTAPDVLMLKLCHPDLIIIEDDEDQCLLEGHSLAVEETLDSMGSHLASARLIIAEFAIRNSVIFGILKSGMAESSDVFRNGLQLLRSQTCRRYS